MDLEEVLDSFMQKNGLRRTQQRRHLLLSIFASDDHFTADQLMDRLRGETSEASRSTVYRTLALLVEAGLLKEVHLGGGQVHYDPNFTENPDHAHLVCVKCGKVEEFKAKELSRRMNKIATERGFREINHMVKIEGVCSDCQ